MASLWATSAWKQMRGNTTATVARPPLEKGLINADSSRGEDGGMDGLMLKRRTWQLAPNATGRVTRGRVTRGRERRGENVRGQACRNEYT